MHERKDELAERLSEALERYNKQVKLPGLRTTAHRDSFIGQLVDSVRRIEFVKRIKTRAMAPSRRDPHSDLFDPIRASILCLANGEVDEASWLVFLSVHCGHHQVQKWQMVKELYGCFGDSPIWSWERVAKGPRDFSKWLEGHKSALLPLRFGNHRKYQSSDPSKGNWTGAAVESYVSWVKNAGSHQQLFTAALNEAKSDPGIAFDILYRSMNVISFGRMARFDYLTMIGKIGIAAINPASAYIVGATGPLQGGRILFAGSTKSRISAKDVDERMLKLGNALGVGMQVMEDSICNWQKSPSKFRPFRG